MLVVKQADGGSGIKLQVRLQLIDPIDQLQVRAAVALRVVVVLGRAGRAAIGADHVAVAD